MEEHRSAQVLHPNFPGHGLGLLFWRAMEPKQGHEICYTSYVKLSCVNGGNQLRNQNRGLNCCCRKRILGFRLTRNKTKGRTMQTMTRIHDPAKAKAYFENKLAFTTGPVEVDRWIKTDQN